MTAVRTPAATPTASGGTPAAATPARRRRGAAPRSVRRLRRLQIGAVALLLAFGALVVTALAVSFNASSRAAESLAQYDRLAHARIQALEVQQAANTWALTPTDAVRADVTDQLTSLATTLADASAVDTDRDRIVPLTGALVHYSMTLQDALNAKGTASAALLAKADTQLSDELLTPLTAARTTAGDRIAGQLTAGWLPWVIGGLVATVGGLIAISVALARASHRYVNPGVALALLSALASVAVLAASSTAAANVANEFTESARAELDAVATAQQQLHQARADEVLAVGLQTAGTPYQTRWTSAYTAILDGVSALPDSTSAASALKAYKATHDQLVSAAGKAQWTTAAGIATDASATAFDKVDTSLNTVGADLGGPVSTGLKSASDGAAAGIAGVIVFTLAGAGLAVWGVARRIEEYR
ncbi:MAG: hypothetical protein QM695_08095 [Micropruina sp.]